MIKLTLKIWVVLFLVSLKISNAQHLASGLITNKVTVNSPEQTIVATIEVEPRERDAELNKTYYWFSAGKIRSTQGGYSGKLLDGAYVIYYPNKNLKEKGNFKKGLKNGEWAEWAEGGTLLAKSNWKEGIQSGDFYQFDEAGKLKKQGVFKKGKLHGRVVTWSGADSVKTAHYKNGVAYTKTDNKGLNKAKKALKKLGVKAKTGTRNLFRKKSSQPKATKEKTN